MQQLKHRDIDVFSHNMLVMPFQSDGLKSLFVVLGATQNKDYMKRGFSNTWPCILHILPYATSMRVQTHAYNQACLRLRAWLNSLWRKTSFNNDFDSMSFTHRSLLMAQPFSECIDKTMTSSFLVYTLFHYNDAVPHHSKKIKGWPLPLEVCILPCNYR